MPLYMTIKVSLAGVVLGLLAACASAPNVSSTLVPGADPGKYRTFVFIEADTKPIGVMADSQVQRRLQQLVASQLAAKGYTPVAGDARAELGVSIAGQVVAKERVLMAGSPGAYDEHRGRVERGGYQTTDYREGTLYIDIIDLAQSKPMWSTQFIETLSAGYSDENWNRVDRALDEAFKNLPAHR